MDKPIFTEKTGSGTGDMRVTKRNGELEEVAFDKILSRVKKLGQEVGIQIINIL